MSQIAGCLGLMILILVALAALNVVIWALVTIFPYAILGLLMLVVVLGFMFGRRY